MTASTPPSAADPYDTPAWYDDADAARHRPVEAATSAAPAPAAAKTRRTVSARVAAVIGVVAFLLGTGVSMLTGPLLGGGPGGPGGPGGGPGGAPGTSQQQSGTGTSSPGTATSGTTNLSTSGT
ncbi:hypothetical protein LQ327_02345 [Actinomycetospora endophytica]|uniref:Uncharacterized protein n=1 Tax=Actinomycetospora endophytica TaxID=2291215 RepID=A0ABS8P1V0_9PSEU|nr:hypothetical protein [Actinomycetospora endophytica]MCD2192235.1 hypothetical protein [Actinomycetospora endophytica]